MRILYLTAFIPYEMPGAGAKTSFQILDYLSQKHKIDLIFSYTNVECQYLEELLHYIDNNKNINLLGMYKVTNISRLLGAICCPFLPILFSTRLNINLFFKLLTIKGRYDLVYGEYSQSILNALIAKKKMKVKTVLSVQDVISQSFMRKYRNSESFVKKIFYYFEWRKLHYWESKLINLSDHIIVQNEKDKKLLIHKKVNIPVSVITPFVDFSMDYSSYRKKNESFNVIFWGAMNRLENIDAVQYYIKELHPVLLKAIPNLNFYIAGANPPDSLKNLISENIKLTGFLENPSEIFQKMDCAFYPLRLGAGIKVKTLEALYMGLPTVTNEIGAEGIDLGEESGLFLCDSPFEMVERICQIARGEIVIDQDSIHHCIIEKYSFRHNYPVFEQILLG